MAGRRRPGDRFVGWLATPRHLVGASLLRIALGALVLYQLLARWPDRELLWGPDGLYPHWLYERDLLAAGAPSLLAVGSPLLFHAVYGVGVLVALLYLLGWQTRWIGVWLYALVWSLVKRNPLLLTGGDTLVLVMLPFVLLLDTAAYLSADAGWRRLGAPAPPPPRPLAAVLHNVALGCVFAQLALFYGFAGIYKLLGETWLGATAVYYTLRLPEFARPGLSELLYRDRTLVALLTYATLVFELTAPLLLWSRRTRWLVTLQALAFHLFIACFMSLVVFSAQALVFQLALHDDGAYRRLAARLRRRPPASSAAHPKRR
jgi:hypothetical protein